MHIEKIFVEQEDEVVFVLEKLNAKKADNIILIISNGSLLLSSVISLKILSSLLVDTNKTAVLVVDNLVDQNIAQKAHLVAVSRLSQVTNLVWKKAESEKQILRKYFSQARESRKLVDIDPIEQAVESKLEDAAPKEKQGDHNFKLKTKNGITFAVGGDIRDLVLDKVATIEHDPKPMSESVDPSNEVVLEDTFDKPVLVKHDAGLLSVNRKRKTDAEVQEDEVSDEPKRKRKSGRGSKKVGKFLVRSLIGLLAVVVLLLLGSYVYLSRAKTVEVDITFAQNKVEVRKTINVDVALDDLDLENLSIPGIEISESKDSSGDAQATGSEEVGETAKGVVDLRNKKEDAKINLSAGTVLTDISSGKNYKLVNNVTIPADEFLPDVPIEAVEIGKSYNQEVEDQFTFKVEGFNTDTLIGFGFRDIAGGKKRKLTVVQKSDIDSLKSSLRSSLEGSLSTDISNSIKGTETFIEGSLRYEEVKFAATAAAGDEVDSFSANIELEANAVKVKNSEIKDIAVNLLKEESGVENLEQIVLKDYDVRNITYGEDGITFRLVAEGNALENLSLEEIKNSIKNLSEEGLDKYLSEQEEIDEYRVRFMPATLPQFMYKVPEDSDKIELVSQ